MTVQLKPTPSLKPSVQLPYSLYIGGLQQRRLGIGSIEITAGTDDPANTIGVSVGGVVLADEVEWVSSHAATATALGAAINANWRNHRYFALVSSATVSLIQRDGGALSAAERDVVAIEGGDVEATVVDIANHTDDWVDIQTSTALGTNWNEYRVNPIDFTTQRIHLLSTNQTISFSTPDPGPVSAFDWTSSDDPIVMPLAAGSRLIAKAATTPTVVYWIEGQE